MALAIDSAISPKVLHKFHKWTAYIHLQQHPTREIKFSRILFLHRQSYHLAILILICDVNLRVMTDAESDWLRNEIYVTNNLTVQ